MGAEPIRRVLASSPRGQTSDQLLWRLRKGGVRLTVDEVLHGLVDLQRSGEIQRNRAGRWVLTAYSVADQATKDSPIATRPAEASATASLVATAARLVPAQISVPPCQDIGAGSAYFSDLSWTSLLQYYEATQRQDPRGRITQFPDRHALQYLVWRTSGAWWREAELVFAEDALPPQFREALARRQDKVLALGYPLSLMNVADVPTVLPTMLIPARWSVEHGQLRVHVAQSDATINPEWLAAITRRTRWQKDALSEKLLLPHDGEPDFAQIVERLNSVLATQVVDRLRPGELAGSFTLVREGIQNAAGLFLPDDSSFTRGAADDLAALGKWPEELREEHALGAIFARAAGEAETPPVLHAEPLTPSQLDAATGALGDRLSVIQGPPGTGKSQVIVSLIVTAVMMGKSVLLASRNHQPLDEVERRLAELAPDASILVRARDGDGGRDQSFFDVLKALAAQAPEARVAAAPDERLHVLLGEAWARWKSHRDMQERERIHVRLSDHVERRALILDKLPDGVRPRLSLWARIWGLVRRMLGSLSGASPKTEAGILPENVGLEALDAAISRDRAKLAKLGNQPESDQPGEARLQNEERLQKSVAELFPIIARRRASTSEEDQRAIAGRVAALEFEGVKSAGKLTRADAEHVLRHRPVWAVSTLSAPKRIPLHPGLFDYVIFDEASQCDIASALPLMARARRAIIVGDPEQLSFIPGLGLLQEHALMDAAGLPRPSREQFAQSTNSLFRFAELLPARKLHFLSDQYRSAPDIVDYLNAEFYRGRLVARREAESLRLPDGYKTGLDWRDVRGKTISPPEGGALNEAEADAIVGWLQELARNPGFAGSVGVLSPFNAQVALLQRKLEKGLSEAQREKFGLKVATIDRFQGGQADIILFSLVAGAGMAQGGRNFLSRERRRFNVAVSRARALCIVFGDLAFARDCGIRHIERLAERASAPRTRENEGFESIWERRMAAGLKRRGLTYHAQHPVGSRRLDFALFGASGIKLDLEVDGRAFHTDSDGRRKTSDILRDREMIGRGWKVRRFWVHELDNNMEACLDQVERDLEQQ